jgi:hypothetical protein
MFLTPLVAHDWFPTFFFPPTGLSVQDWNLYEPCSSTGMVTSQIDFFFAQLRTIYSISTETLGERVEAAFFFRCHQVDLQSSTHWMPMLLSFKYIKLYYCIIIIVIIIIIIQSFAKMRSIWKH